MTAGIISAKLSSLYDFIRPELADIIKKYKQTESYIELIKNKNLVGNNDAERKRNSFCSLESVLVSDGTVINLISLMSDVEGKKQDLEALKDMIDFKRNVMWTMTEMLKTETRALR